MLCLTNGFFFTNVPLQLLKFMIRRYFPCDMYLFFIYLFISGSSLYSDNKKYDKVPNITEVHNHSILKCTILLTQMPSLEWAWQHPLVLVKCRRCVYETGCFVHAYFLIVQTTSRADTLVSIGCRGSGKTVRR